MPGENLQAWSTTAATNSTADTSINWAEGQARASVNNSARSMMAAHAKDRNLKNGSIVTAGTANAQTFTSGVTYTVVPTGLWARLKAGLTNTGAATLNMDGIGAVAIKDQGGIDIAAGALTTGHYIELLYDGTNWILLRQNGAGAAPQCGRLTYVSATNLSFAPYHGDQLKIAGAFYSIPAAGIQGLANTGAFVGGVAAQNLAASTLYYVYAFNNAGVITADFRTTGHASSTTAGNVGTEIMSGDDSRTIIGMIATNASSQFEDGTTFRGVVSWFNRRNICVEAANTAGGVTASGAAVPVGTRAYFLVWADEDVSVGAHGFMYNNTAGCYAFSELFIDGGPAVITAGGISYSSNAYLPAGGAANISVAEGQHFISIFGYQAGGGAAVFYVSANGMIRG